MRSATDLDALQVPDHAELPVRLNVGRSYLATIIGAVGFTRGAEIGVWEGAFAEKLCAPNPGFHLTCVDPWSTQPDYKEGKNDHARMAAAFQTAKSRLDAYNCRLMKMTSAEAAPQIEDGSLDIVYIDGNHTLPHVTKDIQLWLPKVRSGGVIAGHDYTSKKGHKSFIQVAPAVDQYTRDHAIAPWFVLAGDKSASWMWVVR